VVARGFSSGGRINITRTTRLAGWANITAKHVYDPKLIGRWLLAHHRMNELHAVFVGTHAVRAHDEAGEPVGSLFQGSHRSIMLRANHRRTLRNNRPAASACRA
jgi:hypothetical protein